MTVTPIDNTPRYTLTLNAATAGQYGATTLEIGIWCQPFPLGGNMIVLAEKKNGVWGTLANTDPGLMDIYDGSKAMGDINTMGMKAWLKANVCGPVNALIKSVFGPKVAISPAGPPVPSSGPVTQSNFQAKVNEALMGMTLADHDGDGLPELS